MTKRLMYPWNPQFVSASRMFDPLTSLAEKLGGFKGSWPSLEACQALLSEHGEPILTQNGTPVKIVAQGPHPVGLEEQYATRIYLTGEIQTRTENWHDFFQLLTWLIFPKTKATINAVHHHAAKARYSDELDNEHRSPIENMLSLFDEGGAIITCSDESLLHMIRGFDWKNLFWWHREMLSSAMNCTIFGHALYEKALTPYIGMTANCVLLPVDTAFFIKTLPEKIKWIDERLAMLLLNDPGYRTPQALSPFPILGMPGWDPLNKHEHYYDNTAYFRPGRTRNRPIDPV